jgi:hypothetical protein
MSVNECVFAKEGILGSMWMGLHRVCRIALGTDDRRSSTFFNNGNGLLPSNGAELKRHSMATVFVERVATASYLDLWWKEAHFLMLLDQ